MSAPWPFQQRQIDLDPGDTIAHNNLGTVQWSLADTYWTLGEVDEALETLDASRATMELGRHGRTRRVAR